MKTLIPTLLAAAALAVPTAAGAQLSGGGPNPPQRAGFLAVGTGSAASGTFRSRALGAGTYTVSIAANGAARTTPFGSCTRATGTVTLTSTGATPASVTAAATGRLCTPAGTGARLKSAFFGRLTVTSATGAAAAASGGKGLVGLATKADGTSRLFVAAGRLGLLQALRHRFHR